VEKNQKSSNMGIIARTEEQIFASRGLEEDMASCNIVPVRNWLIGVAVGVGFLNSSLWFAWAWEGNPLVAVPSYWSAAGWALGTGATLFFALGALNTFCMCAARIPPCTTPCTVLKAAIVAGLLTVGVCGVLAGWGANYIISGYNMMIALILATAGLAVLTITCIVWGARLGACQG